MYTLRRISGEGAQMNQFLGNSYTLVSKELSPEEFKQSFETHFQKKYEPKNATTSDCESVTVYAFVGGEGGKVIQPLYKNQKNYIVSADGSTFANLTIK